MQSFYTPTLLHTHTHTGPLNLKWSSKSSTFFNYKILWEEEKNVPSPQNNFVCLLQKAGQNLKRNKNYKMLYVLNNKTKQNKKLNTQVKINKNNI